MRADIQFATLGRLSALLISLMVLLAGCGTKEPDAIQLRTDLETILKENTGNTSVGNAEIYRIISLQVTDSVSEDKTHYTMQYNGEVECVQGFYMSADGQYSIAKPTWKAARHVTKGTLIEFTGNMSYELTVRGWQSKQHTTIINAKYAPRI
jgi:hypothetical protein